MTELYLAGSAVLFLLDLAAVSAVVCQGLLLSEVLRTGLETPGQRLGAALETAVLVQAFVQVVLVALVQDGYYTGVIYPMDLAGLRWAVAALIAGLSVLRFFKGHRADGPITLALTAASLPVPGDRAGAALAPLLAAACLGWAARGLAGFLALARNRRRRLSPASIHEALDRMATGILFGPEGGGILIMNHPMQTLMAGLAGTLDLGGDAFFRFLADDPGLGPWRVFADDDRLIFELANGRVWQFLRERFPARRGTYIQLTATDVTQLWHTARDLERENALLARRGDELADALRDMPAFTAAEQTSALRSAIHDIFGHRVALLLASLREHRRYDAEKLSHLIEEIREEIRSPAPPPPWQRLDRLRDNLADIGVTITTRGALPRDPRTIAVFEDIIQEAATNAVRHGLATRIELDFAEEPGTQNAAEAPAGPASQSPPPSPEAGIRLTIRDDGTAPAGPYKEGGGIPGMRQRLLTLEGRLTVIPGPPFTLIAFIPGGGNHD